MGYTGSRWDSPGYRTALHVSNWVRGLISLGFKALRGILGSGEDRLRPFANIGAVWLSGEIHPLHVASGANSPDKKYGAPEKHGITASKASQASSRVKYCSCVGASGMEAEAWSVNAFHDVAAARGAQSEVAASPVERKAGAGSGRESGEDDERLSAPSELF